MDPKLLAVVSFRSLAILFAAQGNEKASTAFNLMATGIQANVNVDGHLRRVAHGMQEGGEFDWGDVTDRIIADGDRLQAKATDNDT